MGELGILRTLGVMGRQLGRSIRWMSLVLLLAALPAHRAAQLGAARALRVQ